MLARPGCKNNGKSGEKTIAAGPGFAYDAGRTALEQMDCA